MICLSSTSAALRKMWRSGGPITALGGSDKSKDGIKISQAAFETRDREWDSIRSNEHVKLMDLDLNLMNDMNFEC